MTRRVGVMGLADSGRGTKLLSPFMVVGSGRSKTALTGRVLAFLANVSAHSKSGFPILVDTVDGMSRDRREKLLGIVARLQGRGAPVSGRVTGRVSDFAGCSFTRLLFSSKATRGAVDLSGRLGVVRITSLILPSGSAAFSRCAAVRLLSITVLVMVSAFTLSFVRSSQDVFGVISLSRT